MAIEEKRRNENEPSMNVLRRFNRKLQESGILKKAKTLRFKTRAKSKFVKKKEALKRIRRQKRADYLKKLGKNIKTA